MFARKRLYIVSHLALTHTLLVLSFLSVAETPTGQSFSEQQLEKRRKIIEQMSSDQRERYRRGLPIVSAEITGTGVMSPGSRQQYHEDAERVRRFGKRQAILEQMSADQRQRFKLASPEERKKIIREIPAMKGQAP